jgi:hypothetical protein
MPGLGFTTYTSQLEERDMERTALAHELVEKHDAWEGAALRALEERLIAGTKKDIDFALRIVRELRARDRMENAAHITMLAPLAITVAERLAG